MSKRAFGKFERRKQDFYETPVKAIVPLINHIYGQYRSYYDPCFGKGAIRSGIESLDNGGLVCVGETDIELDATLTSYSAPFDCFITNPPWTREVLHPMIDNLARQKPTWLLFDADWMHTKQAVPYLEMCEAIVSIGRVSWMGNGVSGFDNCCWYLFDDRPKRHPVAFYGRE